MNIEKELKECFRKAIKDEIEGRKHKGLLLRKSNIEEAKQYLQKAKVSLELCQYYREKGIDFKIPEEWFYTLYSCALVILNKFGVESRSQRYTALFIKYLQDKKLINHSEKFVNGIMVYTEKDKKSFVDEREEARYGHLIKIKEVEEKYEEMMNLCGKVLDETKEILFSNEKFEVPKELLD